MGKKKVANKVVQENTISKIVCVFNTLLNIVFVINCEIYQQFFNENGFYTIFFVYTHINVQCWKQLLNILCKPGHFFFEDE